MLDPLLLLLALQAVPKKDQRVLAEKIKAGDAVAFRIFFDQYHGLLFRYLRRRGVEGSTAEDLVQQAFIKIWEQRAKIDPDKSLRSFLFTIAHNRALNHFRDTAKFADTEAETDRPAPETTDAATESRFLHARLDHAIASLPERRRAVFELCFIQQLTYREAAAVLDVSIKTVENQMGHALKTLRHALSDFL